MRPTKSVLSRLLGCSLLALGLGLLTSPKLTAATFQSNFNGGIPPEITLFGQAAVLDHSTGGVGNSGALKLTDTAGGQSAAAIISDIDAGATVGGFEATFQLYIGSGNGADGFAFFFGDFADGAHSEEGPGSINGLTVTFDVFNNGGTPAEAPAIDVKWNNSIVFHRLVGTPANTTPAQPIGAATTIRTQPTTGGAAVYWPVRIRVDTDGTLDIVYNNVIILTNFPIFRALTDPPVFSFAGYRFGFSARTGGSTDNHWIDDLAITTFAPDANSGQPFIRSIAQVPVGLNAGAAGGVVVELQDGTNGTVNPATVSMRLFNTSGNNPVTPTVTQEGGVTRIAYFGPGGVLPVGTNTATIGYGLTSGLTNWFSWNFAVDPFITVPGSYALASVDTAQPGFKLRIHQFDNLQFIRAPGDGNLIVNAERHLASGYLNPLTGLPYDNVADLSLAGPDGYFSNNVINLNQDAPGAAGQFSVNSNPPREDQPIPGIPGTTLSTDWAAVEILTYVELKAGGHRFGFNSDDGFRASFGPGWDASSGFIVGSFNGGRGAGEGTFFDVVVPQDGFYPLRISWWEGGGGFNAELFWFNPTNGQRILVNDPDNLASPRAYLASTVSRPSISRVLPVQNWIGAFPDEDIIIDITDGTIPLTGGSVSLSINGVAQTITQVKNGVVTTVTRDSSIDNLLPSGLNNVRLIYSFSEGGNPVSVTNNYSFTVAPYYGVLPVANKVNPGDVVTADTGFRGLVDQIDKSGDANQGNGARINGGWDSNRMPFPEIHLFGGNINPTNGLRYPNLALESSPGSWLYDPISPANLVNWAFQATDPPTPANSGMFQSAAPAFPLPGSGHFDEAIPGLPGAGTSPNGNWRGAENYICEITTYLDLKRGVYVFGVNSDDGFVARSGPNVNDTLGTLLGFFNGGRGNSGNLVAPTLTAGQNAPVVYPGVTAGSTIFSVIVPEDGIYPIRILFWQGGTGISTEFYSLNRTNGTVLLVGDTATDPNAVPAYRTYTGPAKPYVKFSISPNPWDSPVQQVGPGPITMVGRTRNAVNSSDIYNFNNTAFPSRPWANVVIGGVIGNGTSSATLGLLLNGTPVPVTLTTNGTDVTVAYQPNPPLPSGSTNTASLIYAGTTNSWTFIVQSYATLNAGDAQPLGAADPASRGFRVKMTQIATVPAGYTQSSVRRAEDQLAGVIGPDLAIPGTGPGGSHIYTNILNWNNNVQTNVTPAPSGVPLGNFQAAGFYGAGTGWPFPNYPDTPLPGVPGTGRVNVDNAAAEVFAYLEFPTAGYYRLGVNGDDGFALKVGTPGVTNGMVLFTMDLGKGASDIPVSFVVPQPGLYPIRLVYYNGGGGAALEFFSYDASGGKIPINDPNNPASIKAYYAVLSVALPRITSATITGNNITVVWENGGTLWSAPTVDGPWTSTGDSDGSFTEAVTGTMKYYRAILQQ